MDDEISRLRADIDVDDESLWACRHALLAVVEAAGHAREESWDAERGDGWRDAVVDPKAWQALSAALDTLRTRIREVLGDDHG